MKIVSSVLFGAIFSLLLISQGIAATSEVKWTNPEDYRDIHPGDSHRKHFRERTFRTLERHFSKLAEKLPEGQILKIDVTNIDLAGDVNYGGLKRFRIIKEIYFPKMSFAYQVLDMNNAEISANEVNLKNMNFMMNTGLRYRNKSLGYELKMLDDWFKETFEKSS